MKDKGRQRLFLQIHLSTFLLLILAAAILLWVNLLPRKPVSSQPGKTNISLALHEIGVRNYGWPFHAYTHFEKPLKTDDPETFKPHWEIKGLLLNVTIAIFILGSTGLLIETVHRHRYSKEA